MTLAIIAALLAAPADQPEPETRWYGWQTLLADAASLTVGAIAVSHKDEPYAGRFPSPALVLGSIAAAGYLIAPPVIHLLNGNRTGTASSVLLRLGIPAAAALLSLGLYAAAWGSCGNACAYALVAIDGAALVAPIVIDAAVLARAPGKSP